MDGGNCTPEDTKRGGNEYKQTDQLTRVVVRGGRRMKKTTNLQTREQNRRKGKWDPSRGKIPAHTTNSSGGKKR